MLFKDRFMIQTLVDFAGHYIFPDNDDDPDYTELCSQHMDESMERWITKMAMISFGAMIGIGGTVYSYVMFGVLITTIEGRIPFTEGKSEEEFLVNLIIEFIIYINATFLYFGIEIMMKIFTNVVMIAPTLAHYKLEKLIEAHEMGRISDAEACAAFQPIEHFSVESEK